MKNLKIPPVATLITNRSELDFLHSASAVICNGPTALQAYYVMTEATPAWLKGAFMIRDKISAPFQVAKIAGFSGVAPQITPVIGEKLDFFTVEAIDEQKLVLTSRDTHLAVMVSIDLIDDVTRELCITTSVKTFNTFGRLYMVPVSPVHGVIINLMLARLSRLYPAVPRANINS